jgi:hypothetical protein
MSNLYFSDNPNTLIHAYDITDLYSTTLRDVKYSLNKEVDKIPTDLVVFLNLPQGK